MKEMMAHRVYKRKDAPNNTRIEMTADNMDKAIKNISDEAFEGGFQDEIDEKKE